METKTLEVAERLKGLREMENISCEDMAQAAGVSVDDYILCESGGKDFSFTFIYKCARKLGVDLVELLTGENAKLSFYSIVRRGEGLDIKRRAGFVYEHLGYQFKNKESEPFLVTAPYIEQQQDQPIELSVHEGQEFNFVISGTLKIQLEDKIEVLETGDAIYFDSGRRHGMIATGGEDCTFIAVVLKNRSDRNA